VKRKPISASTRWQIFARDGFRCRYCGIQAGDDGVTLHLDHVVSVADGGTNAFDNLVTACQRCNGGKSARSLDEVPGSAEAIEFARDEAASLQAQAEAMEAAREAHATLQQEIVNTLCDAYGVDSINIRKTDGLTLMRLAKRHGGALLFEWIYETAYRSVRLDDCTRYINGIVRKRREEGAA
jgi:hypothetical protein